MDPFLGVPPLLEGVWSGSSTVSSLRGISVDSVLDRGKSKGACPLLLRLVEEPLFALIEDCKGTSMILCLLSWNSCRVIGLSMSPFVLLELDSLGPVL